MNSKTVAIGEEQQAVDPVTADFILAKGVTLTLSATRAEMLLQSLQSISFSKLHDRPAQIAVRLRTETEDVLSQAVLEDLALRIETVCNSLVRLLNGPLLERGKSTTRRRFSPEKKEPVAQTQSRPIPKQRRVGELTRRELQILEVADEVDSRDLERFLAEQGITINRLVNIIKKDLRLNHKPSV